MGPQLCHLLAWAAAVGLGPSPCDLPPAAGYGCVSGFCGVDPSPSRPAPPRCQAAIELRLGGSSAADRVALAAKWCNASGTCTAFSIDPSTPVTLAFTATNLTELAQPNSEWTLYTKGLLPPLPPTPAPPSPAPTAPIFPDKCSSAADCSLNGVCDAVGVCHCNASWRGKNCETLDLQPVPQSAYGYGLSPNITSWGGSIWKDNSTGEYHLFVTEETDGVGMASWVSHSQIVRAVATSPLGPYTRKAVVSGVPTTNPQILQDPKSGTFLLFHIRGGGEFQLTVSSSIEGPFVQEEIALGGCNNPTAAWHPNGTLYVMCHDGQFSLYGFHPNADGTPPWKSHPAPAIPTLRVGGNPHVPGNCEDPFLHITQLGHFHVLAHCYTCYWYPSAVRPPGTGSASGTCLPGSAFCSGHGFSVNGEAGSWTWVGGPQAPYNFTSSVVGNGVRTFSTRERPWALMGGPTGDDIVALINGVSPSMPTFDKFTPGRDWCFTNIQAVGSP